MTPTQRSLARLRAAGYAAEVVEKRIPKVFITKDLFGFIDILAIRAGEIVGVQTTSGSNAAARVAKIRASKLFPIVIASGMRVVVHGWAKRGARGKRKVWVVREEQVDSAPIAPADTEGS